MPSPLQDYVDAPLSIPDFLTCSLNIDWSQYQVRLGGTEARQREPRSYPLFLFLMQRLSS